jgi:hypothetical protein
LYIIGIDDFIGGLMMEKKITIAEQTKKVLTAFEKETKETKMINLYGVTMTKEQLESILLHFADFYTEICFKEFMENLSSYV